MTDGNENDHPNLIDADQFLIGELEDPIEDGEEVGEGSTEAEATITTRNSLIAQAESFSVKSLQESVIAGPLSEFFDPNDTFSNHESQGSIGSPKDFLSPEEDTDEQDGENGDDEYSIDEGESRRNLTEGQQSQWNELTVNNKKEYKGQEDEENEDEDEDEEEEEGNFVDWRHRKKLYHFTQFKQDRLIVNYMQSITKLKLARKKNMYLQDRIHKHLQEKEKVLNQCREAVKDRKEKAILQYQSTVDVKGPRKQEDDHEDEECDLNINTTDKEGKVEPPLESKPKDGSHEAMLAKYKKENKHRKKCKRRLQEKQGKGASKTARLSMKHYHTDSLLSKKQKQPKVNNCERNEYNKKRLSKGTNDDSEDDRSGDEEFQKRKSRRSSNFNDQEATADPELNTTLYGEIQKQRASDVDELEDSWRYRHEKRRSKEIRKSRQARQSIRKSTFTGAQDDPAAEEVPSSRKSHKPSFDSSGQFIEQNYAESYEESQRQKRQSKKRTCRETMRRRKSIHDRKLKALQKANEINEQVIMQKDEEDEEEKETEEALPEFKYELSDISLTKMKYGAKMRQELEKVVLDTKLPIHLEWPLSIKGFNDYFKRTNPYGKVIYTMRLQSQIRQARKISRKYKYVMHNYNYQIQQYNVLKEVHESNMKYLEISKQKWEFLVEELLSRVVTEMRDYSEIATDSSGKRIPLQQVDRFCKEITKEFENFQYTARIFYRVLHNGGVAIRHLCYSENHGEGVELFEFKHLLRANETIGAQHDQKRDTLKGYKRRTKQFINTYQKQLNHKDDIEIDVTEKFRLSGEISCMMAPKQTAVKSFEGIAKTVMKKEAALRIVGGIVPYKHLVTDYENMYMRIEERRQVRREFQLKYNSRVREVHEIFDKMDEIQRKVPELFVESSKPIQKLNACGESIEDEISRPKTAPPSSRPSRMFSNNLKQTDEQLPSVSVSKASTVPYLSEAESRKLLEGSVISPMTAAASISRSRPKTATSSFRSINRQLPDRTASSATSKVVGQTSSTLPPIGSGTEIPKDSKSRRQLLFRLDDDSPIVDTSTRGSISGQIRPSTAASGGKRLSTAGERRPSTAGDKRLSTGGDKRLSTGGEKSLITAGNKRLSIGGEKRPSTVGDKRLSTGGEKRFSTVGDKRPSTVPDKPRGSLRYSKMIAGEQAEIVAAAKRKTIQLTRPTAAKAGIVPMITKENMLTIAKGMLPRTKNHTSTAVTSAPPRRSTMPMRSFLTAPISPYESEVKNWPYQYYTRRSPQIENTSKRRMDVVLGSLVHQPRPVSYG